MTEEQINQATHPQQDETLKQDAKTEQSAQTNTDENEEVIAELDDNELSALEQMQARINELETELAASKAALAEKDEEVLRVVAEGMNLQKRMQRDIDNTRKFSNDKIIKAMIPVMDSFDKALQVAGDDNCEVTAEAMIEGTQNTQKLFAKVLEDNGIEIINPLGEAFDPEQHEAMSMVPSVEHQKNTIIDVFQKGYLLNGRVVRAAMVVVAQ